MPKAPHRVAATRHCLFLDRQTEDVRICSKMPPGEWLLRRGLRILLLLRMSRWFGDEWPLVASVFATDDRGMNIR